MAIAILVAPEEASSLRADWDLSFAVRPPGPWAEIQPAIKIIDFAAT